ncbi:hypothetical protein ACLQ29_24315 [Micromonospora sp. DT228]|uniref:hypothetical protein n=1 Tax=Micromonospora sp. DT228 TaxID=3393443 RepID=UPI003CFADCDB
MPTYVVKLARPVPASHSDHLSKRVFYVAPDITNFILLWEGDRVTGVELTTGGETDPQILARKIEEISRAEVLPQRLLASDVVWRSPHPVVAATDIFAELVKRGVVYEMGEGAIATAAAFTDVLEALDRQLSSIATDHFQAVEYRYPTLIKTSALRLGNYLRSFPQLIMYAGRLTSDLENYRRFLDEIDEGADADRLLTRHGEHSGYCLPPTMCFHTYHQLSGTTLADDDSVITSRGQSFRFESRYQRSLERLWDFTIREIVFLGDEHAVTQRRERFLHEAGELVADLGLAGLVESADDPFFGDREVARRGLAQRLRRLKYELRLPAEDGRTMSAASFNLHGTMFGEAYDIRLPSGQKAHTACVGFGLERFTFALFCQHGADPAAWPEHVRDRLVLPPRHTSRE